MGKNLTKSIISEHPLSSAHLQAILDALEYQGYSNDCGPYTTASVINGLLGDKVNPATLAAEMSKPARKGLLYLIRRIPNWATFPWGMVDIFRRYGLEARWKIWSSPDELLRLLKFGGICLPILGSWRPLGAHVMALIAWDPNKGWGFANTQYNHHNITWLEHKQFMRNWKFFMKPVIEVRYSPKKRGAS